MCLVTGSVHFPDVTPPFGTETLRHGEIHGSPHILYFCVHLFSVIPVDQEEVFLCTSRRHQRVPTAGGTGTGYLLACESFADC